MFCLVESNIQKLSTKNLRFICCTGEPKSKCAPTSMYVNIIPACLKKKASERIYYLRSFILSFTHAFLRIRLLDTKDLTEESKLMMSSTTRTRRLFPVYLNIVFIDIDSMCRLHVVTNKTGKNIASGRCI